MALYKAPQPQSRFIPYPPKQYGVFHHEDPDDPTAEPELVHLAPDFNTAYSKLCDHASDEASQRPDWGRTKEITSSKTYDILGFDGKVRTRYEIAVLRQSGYDDDGIPVWMRERDWLSKQYLDRPNEHYGMYVDIDCHDKSNTKNFLVGGFSTPGEASEAMKQSAGAYLAQHKGARLYERSIELVNEKGEVQQRYLIVKGRWRYGEFVKEDAWLEKEAELLRKDAYPSPPPTAKEGKTPIVRLPGGAPSHHQEPPAPAPDEELPDANEDAETWCTCRQPDDGSLMICCENDDCPIQWYHGRCVGLMAEPKGKWWCATCKPKTTKRGGKGKKGGKKRKTG